MATQPKTSSAHTAGPWTFTYTEQQPDGLPKVFGPDGLEIAEVHGEDNTNREANAALISKAWLIPELVASLNAMIDAADDGEIFNHDHSGCEDCILCDARKVIAKAA